MIYDAKKPSSADLDALGDRKPECTTDSLDDFHDIVVSKPWGSEYLLFENNDVAVWILSIEAGQKTSMHCHPQKNTSLIVLGGEAICRTLEQEHTLLPGQGIYIGKKVFHQSTNGSSERIFMMEIESPVDKSDLVRLEDGYGRIDCGYEGAEFCEKQKNLTMASNMLVAHSKERQIGASKIIIGYARTMADLEVVVAKIEHATLSILDRHVWTSEGEKFFEVGQAFKFDDRLSPENFNINTGFHYLLISE